MISLLPHQRCLGGLTTRFRFEKLASGPRLRTCRSKSPNNYALPAFFFKGVDFLVHFDHDIPQLFSLFNLSLNGDQKN